MGVVEEAHRDEIDAGVRRVLGMPDGGHGFGIPLTLIFGPDGAVYYLHHGYSPSGDFLEELSWEIESLRPQF